MTLADYKLSSPYDIKYEAHVVCEAIGSHCHSTVRSALHEAYHAGRNEDRDRIAAILRTFYLAELSLSSVQPVLDLAVELNPDLTLAAHVAREMAKQ